MEEQYSMIENKVTVRPPNYQCNGIWDRTEVDQKMTMQQLVDTFVRTDDAIYILNLEDICVVNQHEKIDQLTDNTRQMTPDALLNQLNNINIWTLKDSLMISLVSIDT